LHEDIEMLISVVVLAKAKVKAQLHTQFAGMDV
jgi:hypothetical protein